MELNAMELDAITLGGGTLTQGTLLGGRVSYRQLRNGYRTGLEPVLLAASLSVRPGMRVLEAGTGAGAGLLCLLARVPGVIAAGVEQDAGLAELARANLAANAHPETVIHAADFLALSGMPPFDHVMANPPWHHPCTTPSPDKRRDAAKRASPQLLTRWTAAMARLARAGGGVTVIVPASGFVEAAAALEAADCGSLAMFPLWPRQGQDARMVLLRGTKAGRGACRVAPGLVLHEGDGFTSAARAVLWEGAALDWG